MPATHYIICAQTKKNKGCIFSLITSPPHLENHLENQKFCIICFIKMNDFEVSRRMKNLLLDVTFFSPIDKKHPHPNSEKYTPLNTT